MTFSYDLIGLNVMHFSFEVELHRQFIQFSHVVQSLT